jgi:hypothetical protein
MVPSARFHNILRRWFLAWNRKYFNNRLPLNTQLVIEANDTKHAEVTSYYDGTYKISIDPATLYFLKFAKLNLLHEMVHLDHFVTGHPRIQHGALFQLDMVRLAQLGALKDIW